MNSNVQTLLGTTPVITGQTSNQIGYVPTGRITSLNVQDAITQASEAILPIVTEAPTDTPAVGTMRFGENILYVYNGTAWVSTLMS